MIEPGWILAVLGLLCVLVTWALYLAAIPRGTVPARPIGSVLFQLAGMGAAVAAIVVEARGGGVPGAVVLAPSAVALVMGSLFLFLLTQRMAPVGALAVAVGDPLLAFAARTSDGGEFHTDSLRGRRILLKFFRGGW